MEIAVKVKYGEGNSVEKGNIDVEERTNSAECLPLVHIRTARSPAGQFQTVTFQLYSLVFASAFLNIEMTGDVSKVE